MHLLVSRYANDSLSHVNDMIHMISDFGIEIPEPTHSGCIRGNDALSITSLSPLTPIPRTMSGLYFIPHRQVVLPFFLAQSIAL